MSSSSGVVEISRRGSRYIQRDVLLAGWVGHAGFTAKEVAVEVLRWEGEKYANAQKRANDLVKLGYVLALPDRVCRVTGRDALCYRPTESGLAYLQKKGIRPVLPAAQDKPVPAVAGRAELSKLRGLLGGV